MARPKSLAKPETVFGGEVISRILAAEGVERVFGIIDGTYFGFYSTLGTHGITLTTPRQESCAAHMAGAYARTTGKLGVCMASNGPGVANILPGVAVESAEGNRVLLITSSRRQGIAYPDRGGTFQCFPQVEVTRPLTKWSVAVPSADRTAEIMRRAFRILWEGRPGVVHVDVPESVMNGKVEVDPTWFRAPQSYRVLDPPTASEAEVGEAARLLRDCTLPLIHAGSGVIHACATDALHEVAELLQAPITTSWGGRSGALETSSLVIPLPYLDIVSRARAEADAVLALGSRIGETDWWGKAPYWGTPEQQALVQVDLDVHAIGVSRPCDVPVHGDVGDFLRRLAAVLRRDGAGDLAPRKKALRRYEKAVATRRKKLDKHLADKAVPMHPAHAPNVCDEVFVDDAIFVVDGGNTAIWASFFHQVRSPGSWLTTFKMGMLGAGVPQALGAQIAHPGRQVCCILGDGAMGMQQQEIETAVRNDLPVVFLVLCDKQWGMVKMNQQFTLKPIKTLLLRSLGPDETINADFCETRYDDLARSMGAHGERVADPAGLRGAIERSLASGKPAVIHVDVDPVKHMWAPALREFKAMHAEPSGRPR